MNFELSPREFTLMQKFIENECGINLGEEKAYLIENRLGKLLPEIGISSFEELYLILYSRKQPDIIDKVIDEITTNETFWFRDRTPWDTLDELLLPGYIEDIRKGKRKKIRIWSSACSTGQEPYSVAICIDNYLGKNGINDIGLDSFEIFATDISNEAVRAAKDGRYDSTTIMRGLNESYRDKYFKNEGTTWSLDDRIKERVCFRQFNLKSSFMALGKFDIIFCRNVFIYFSDKFKKELIKRIASVIQTEGVMFVGSSEIIPGIEESFKAERYNNYLFYRQISNDVIR